MTYNHRMSDEQPNTPANEQDEEWYADGLSFSCQQCGNCCSGPPGYVWFDEHEAEAMAAQLEIPVEVFLKTYAKRKFGRWTLDEVRVGGRYDCVFLRRDEQGKALCSVYQTRPTQCRTWPFWPSNLGSPRDWQESSRTCHGMKAGGPPQRGEKREGTFFPIEKIRVILDSNPLEL